MNGLTKAQRRVLLEMAKRCDYYYTPWVLGIGTCNALLSKGLVEGVCASDHHECHFTGRFRHDPTLRLTEAGREALRALEKQQ